MKSKYLLPRELRESLGRLKQFCLFIVLSDKSKLLRYKSYFKSTKTIFIHIPKCAGTSVALALYGEDPWHFSIREFSEKQLNENLTFAIVRDPVDRLISIYKYLCKESPKYPNTFYSDISSCGTFEKFFSEYIEGIKDSDRIYFLRSQSWYLQDKQGSVRVKHIILMERLDMDFPVEIKNICGFNNVFPKKNLGSKSDDTDIDDGLIAKIKKEYYEDYELIENI